MKKDKGVLTLEAAIMIPMFVFAILFITQFMKLSFIYDTVQTNIYNTAKFINGYTYLQKVILESDKVQDINKSIVELVGESNKEYVDKFINSMENEALAYIIKSNLEEEFERISGDNYTEKLGINNFDCRSSQISFGDDGEIKVIVEYSIKVNFPIFDINKDIRFRNKVVISSFS